jgi:ABC-2 type transport system permease protein
MSVEHLDKWDRGIQGTLSNVILRTVFKIVIIWELELRKIRRDYTDVLIRAIQPVLWLTIFGVAFSHISQIFISELTNAVVSGSSSSHGISYLAYLTPGILAQSVLFISIFTGISMIWERDLGQLDRLLCSPIPRTAIVLGKSFTGAVRGIMQAAIIFVIAVVMGVSIILNPLNLAAVAGIVFIFAIGFSSLSIAVSTCIKSRERIFGLVQLFTMPLFFASSALYPTQLMPQWLQVISYLNPMTYAVDALRILMITGNYTHLVTDLEALGISTMIFVCVATIAFRKVER